MTVMRARLRPLTAPVASVAAVALVTGGIFGLREFAPVLSLGVLYVIAVVGVAVVWGLRYAIPVAVASMLAFNWFFLPPVHTFTLAESGNWVALAVYLVTAVVVSDLAGRSRHRAEYAEQREREATLLAEVSAVLLEAEHVQSRLGQVAVATARVLGVPRLRIELDSVRRTGPDEAAHELRAGARSVGRVFLPNDARPDPETLDRVLSALASLLGVAGERERLAHQALESQTLRRSDAAKTTLLRSVSHDLRSPLTTIRAASDGLQSGALDLSPGDRATLAETIGIEARRLERLVGNLLELSRLEVGAAEPRLELWTIDDLIGRALDDLAEGSDRVSVVLHHELPPVRVDGVQIERALVNLVENALKFSKLEVRVTAAETNDELVVSVADRGPGLAADELKRIFSPFERGARDGGTGLGLAIARGFAETNGGRVWAASRVGEGTTFSLALPTSVASGSAT